MTKKEIVKELEKYGVKATTRARKATLEALLNQLEVDSKKQANRGWNLEIGLAVAAVVFFVAGVVYNS